jgi:ligand-binding sensor domain-containing protein
MVTDSNRSYIRKVRIFWIGLFLFFLLLANCCGGMKIPDLIINYSDFSYITSIAVGYHYVYYGTTNGITRYNLTNDQWVEPMMVDHDPGGGVIHQIWASFDDENIWVRTDLGIFEYSDVMEQWIQIIEMPQVETNSTHLPADEIYFPPWGYNYLPGGVLVDEHDRRFPLTDIVDDGWGNLWMGTWGLGAARSDNAGRRIELLPYGLLQKDIKTIHRDKDNMWMGGGTGDSYRTGITKFNPKNNSFEYVETFGGYIYAAADVYDLCSNEFDIFAATNNGVWVIDKEKMSIRNHLKRSSGLPDNQILTLLSLGDTLFVGTEYGLGVLNIYADSARRISKTILPSLTVLCLEKAGNDLWIGTTEGVYRLDLETGKIDFLTTGEITQSGYVYDIEFANGKIWLVTDEELASIDVLTADVTTYPEVNNYGGAGAIAVKDTLVAVATLRGLLLIYTGDGKSSQIYTTVNGLLSDNIRDLIFDDEYLWLGTDSGLVRFWYKNPSL